MPQSKSLFSETLVATAPVTKARAVLITGAHAGAAGVVFGVSEVGAAIGAAFAATREGTGIIEAGEALTKGDRLASDANGKAVAVATTEYYFGIAGQDAAGDGSLIEFYTERGIEP